MSYIRMLVATLLELMIVGLLTRKPALARYMALIHERRILRSRLRAHELSIHFTDSERAGYLLVAQIQAKVRRLFSLVSPDTVLNAWKKRLKQFWTYPSQTRPPGRPKVTQKIRRLILDMKKANPSFGCLRIAAELGKLSHDVSKDTVRRVLQRGRKEGDLVPTGSWRRFLKAHWDSLFASDFFTIDTVGFTRYYAFFIMELASRRIVRVGLTTHPTRRFVRSQLIEFMSARTGQPIHLIHDNSGEMRWLDYASLGITSAATTPYAPNMNAYAERFVGSIRRECLDRLVLFTRAQVWNAVRAYIEYYNSQRPHQACGNMPLSGTPPPAATGRIRKRPVLFGLQTEFYRDAA